MLNQVASGTLVVGTGETAGMAGFWELHNDILTLHMLVEPRGVLTRHPLYQESYYYQYRSAQVLHTRPDAFDISVGVPQAAGTQYTLTRYRQALP